MPPARAAEVMSWDWRWPTQFAIMSRLARLVIVDGASGKFSVGFMGLHPSIVR
jgi:hypothetical protein